MFAEKKNTFYPIYNMRYQKWNFEDFVAFCWKMIV